MPLRPPFAPSVAWDKPLFPVIIRGRFISRPNRFVIRCGTEKGVIEAYLPNPGRLWELLLPGCTVYLVARESRSAGKLSHLAVAVERDRTPILLHTHLSNTVVAKLIAAGKIPGLEGARIIRPEVTVGNSRFDFLLEKEGRPFYLEVKSCTLFGRSIAMFPDAVTLRGKRHLEELGALARQGTACGVIFLVHWTYARFFLPDYHTDLDFALAFQEVKESLFIRALALDWQPDLRLGGEVRELAIPWEMIDREAQDRGSYIIMLRVAADLQLAVGSLGDVSFPRGYYLYVGSAKRALTKRLERHLRKNKIPHWHIDYLRPHADRCTAIPIRTGAPLEHELAAALADIADWSVPAFGSSDCHCSSHLFGLKENPLRYPPFIELLQYFRMDRLEKEIAVPPV